MIPTANKIPEDPTELAEFTVWRAILLCRFIDLALSWVAMIVPVPAVIKTIVGLVQSLLFSLINIVAYIALFILRFIIFAKKNDVWKAADAYLFSAQNILLSGARSFGAIGNVIIWNEKVSIIAKIGFHGLSTALRWYALPLQLGRSVGNTVYGPPSPEAVNLLEPQLV